MLLGKLALTLFNHFRFNGRKLPAILAVNSFANQLMSNHIQNVAGKTRTDRFTHFRFNGRKLPALRLAVTINQGYRDVSPMVAHIAQGCGMTKT